MNIYNKKRSGFTLIELLIVILIIGILATIIVISLVGAEQKAKDSKLESNAQSLNTALAEYNTDLSSYPVSASVANANGAAPVVLSSNYSLDTYVSGEAKSGIFTFLNVWTGYLTDSAGDNFAFATGLQNTSYGTVTTDNGVYLVTTNSVSPGNSSSIGGDITGIQNVSKAFVIYGPQ